MTPEEIQALRDSLQYPNTEFNVFGKVMGGLTTAGAGYVAVDSLIKSNRAKKEAKKQQGYVDTLMSQYMSKPIYNPYQNLSVATQAAEIKQQETDQALANTLDTIRQLGYGAGGATALARAAQKSKLGIAADIEKQEVANEQLKGKGEMIVQQAEFSRLGQQMDYEQSKADQARAEQFGYAERGMDAIAGLGSIGLAMGRGLAKPKSQQQETRVITDHGSPIGPQEDYLSSPEATMSTTDYVLSLTGQKTPANISTNPANISTQSNTPIKKTTVPNDKLDIMLALRQMYPDASDREIYKLAGLNPDEYDLKERDDIFRNPYAPQTGNIQETP